MYCFFTGVDFNEILCVCVIASPLFSSFNGGEGGGTTALVTKISDKFPVVNVALNFTGRNGPDPVTAWLIAADKSTTDGSDKCILSFKAIPLQANYKSFCPALPSKF